VVVLGACAGQALDNGESGACPGSATPPLAAGDPTFGTGGLATVNSGPGLSALGAVATQRDGKLVAAGTTAEELVVTRVTADGQLDTSFGSAGLVLIPLEWFYSPSVTIVGLAVLADDRIAVALTTFAQDYGSANDSAVFRLTADGALDCSFGSGGRFLDANPVESLAVGLGDALLVGEAGGLTRLTPDGAVDTSFGSAGHAVPGFDMSFMAVTADGKIVGGDEGGLLRYDANGMLDTSFGNAGELVVPSFDPTSIALAPDGKRFVGGLLVSSSGTPPMIIEQVAVMRTTVDGVLDTSFGSGNGLAVGFTRKAASVAGVAVVGSGVVVDSWSFSGPPYFLDCSVLGVDGVLLSSCQVPLDAAAGPPLALADGSFVVPGMTSIGGVESAALAISSESAGGVSATAVGGQQDVAEAFALQADGAIVVVGASGGALGPVIRVTPTGALDTTFGSGGGAGNALATSQFAPITDVALQSTGRIVVAQAAALPDAGVIARFDGSGGLDPSFGSGGKVTIATAGSASAFAIAGQLLGSNDTIDVFGNAGSAVDPTKAAIARLTADGAIDASYGSGGFAISPTLDGSGYFAAYATLGSDGSVFVLGTGMVAVSVVRFTATGAFDAAFAGGGKLVLGALTPMGLVRQRDGKLVAVTSDTFGGELDVYRFAADGTLDQSFGVGGMATLQLDGGNDYVLSIENGNPAGGPSIAFNPAGLALDPAGNLLIGIAVATPDGLSEQAAIVRLTSDGTPDAAWGPGGVQLLDVSTGPSAIHALAFQLDGKLLVAGRAWTPTGSSDFAIARLVY
jgi:uncharacterized delta-60 repeat protein